MTNEEEQRRRRRGQHCQTKIAEDKKGGKD
jgi:hypothetical protein